MSEQKFIEIMQDLKAGYGGKFPELDKKVLNVWYRGLSDLDDKRAEEAVIKYIKDNKFPPTIAELREYYRSIPKQEDEEDFEEPEGEEISDEEFIRMIKAGEI